MTTTDPRIEAASRALVGIAFSNESERELEQIKDARWNVFVEDAVAALAAADAVDPLRQPGHRVDINGDDWTLQHPAECRPDMLACPLNVAVREYDVTAMADGTYTVVKTGEGDLLLMAELNS